MEMLNANHRRKSKLNCLVLLLMIFLLESTSGNDFQLTNGVNYEESFPVAKKNADETQPGDQTFAGNQPQAGILATLSSTEQDGDQDADIFVAEIFPDQPGGLEQIFKPLARYKKAILGLDAQIEPSDMKEPYEGDDSEFVVPALATKKFGENIPGSTPLQDFTNDVISNGEDRLRNFEKDSRHLQDDKIEGQKLTGYNSYREASKGSGSLRNGQDFKGLPSSKYPEASGSHENKGEQEKQGLKAGLASYEDYKGHRGVQFEKGVNEGASIKENVHPLKSSAEMYKRGDNNLWGKQETEHSKTTVAEQDEFNNKAPYRGNSDEYEGSGSGEGSADGQEESGSGKTEGQAKLSSKDDNKYSARQSKVRNFEPRNWGSTKDEVEVVKIGEHEVTQENVTLVSEEEKKFQGSEKSAEKLGKEAEKSKGRILENRKSFPTNSTSKKQISEENEIKRLDTKKELSTESETNKDKDITGHKDLSANGDTNIGNKNNQSKLASNTQLTSESKEITMGTSEQVSTNGQAINNSHTLHEDLQINRYMGNGQENGVNKEIQQKRNDTGDSETDKSRNELKDKQQDVGVDDDGSNIEEETGGKITSSVFENGPRNGVIKDMQQLQKSSSTDESQGNEVGKDTDELYDSQGGEEKNNKDANSRQETKAASNSSTEIGPKNDKVAKMKTENNARDETKGGEADENRTELHGMQNDEESKNRDVDIAAKTGGKIVDIFVDNALQSNKDRETSQQLETNEKRQNETNNAAKSDTSTSKAHEELEPTETTAINTTENNSQHVKNSNSLVAKGLQSMGANSDEETTEVTGHGKAENAEAKEGISETRKQAGVADGNVIADGLIEVSKINDEARTAKAQNNEKITGKNIESDLGNPNKKGEETNSEEGAPKIRGHETNKNTVANDSMVLKSQENGMEEARRGGKISEDNDSENAYTYGKVGPDSKPLDKGIISDDGSVKENQAGLGLQSNSGSPKAGFQNKEHMNVEHSTQDHLSTSQSLNGVHTSRAEDKGISDHFGNRDRFQKRKESPNQTDGPKAAEEKKVSFEQTFNESKEYAQERKENEQEGKENEQERKENEQERKENEQERKENEQERKENVQESKENEQELKENGQESKEYEHESKENEQESKENEQDRKENVQERKENEQERKEYAQERKENAQELKENGQEREENAKECKENEHEGLVNISKDDLLKTRLSSEEAARKLFLSIVHGNNTDENGKDASMEEKKAHPANIDHSSSSSVEKGKYVNMVDKTEEGPFSTAKVKSPNGAGGKLRESYAEQEVSGIKEAMNVTQEDNSGDAENHDENVGRSPKQGNEQHGMFTGKKGRLVTKSSSNESSVTTGNITSFSDEVTQKTVAQQNEDLGLISQHGNEDQGKVKANETHSSNKKDVTQANMTSFSKEETPSEQSSANESPVDMMELNSTNVAGFKVKMKTGPNDSVVSETQQPARQINNPFDKVTEQLFGVKLQDDMDESEAENKQFHDKVEVRNETRSDARVNLKAWNDNTVKQKGVKLSPKVEGQKDQSTVRQNSKAKNASKLRRKPKPSQQLKEGKHSKDRHQAKEQQGQEERQQTELRLQNKERQWFKNKQQFKTKQGRRKHRSGNRKKDRKVHGRNLDFSTMLMSQKARELYMNLIHDTSQALMTKKRHKTARRRHFQTHSKLSPFMIAQHLRASHIPLENSITMQYSESKAGKISNAAADAIEPVKGVHELAGKLLSTMMENDQKLMKQTALRPMDGKMDAARKHYVAEKLDTPSSLIGKLAELKVDVNLDKKEKEVPAPHNENIEDASLKEATLENENPGKTVMQKQKGAGLSNNVDLDKLDGSKQEYEYKVLDAKIEGELAKSEDETSKGEDIGELALKQRNASAANLTQPVARAKPSIGNLSVYNTEESLGSEAQDYQNEANDDMNERMYLKQKDVKQVGDFELRKNESNVVLGRKLKDREEGMLRKNEEGMLRLGHGKNLTVSWHRHPSLYFDGNSSLWKHHDVVSMDIEPLVDVFYKVNHENLVDLVEHPELVRKEQKLRVKGMLQGHQKILQRKDGAKKDGRYKSKHGMQPLSKQLKSKQLSRLQQWIQRMQLLSKQRAITTQLKQETDSKQLEESKQRTLSEPWEQLKQRPLQSQKMLSEPWKQRKYDEEKDDGVTHHQRKQTKSKGSKGRGRNRKNHKANREKGRTDEERKVSHANNERKMGNAESEHQMDREQNDLQMGHGEEEHRMIHADKDHNVGHAENELQMGREKNNREMGHSKKEPKMGHAREERKMSHQGRGNKMSHEASVHKMQQADSKHEVGHAEKQRKIGSQENKHAAGNFEKQEHKVKAKNKKMFHHHYRHKHKKPVQGTAKFGISGSEQSASPAQEPKFKNNMPTNVKYFLIENAAKRGALCIDGSTPGYYLRRGFGSGEKNWIIHLHGGAWCYDAQSCYRRSFSILGSTNHWSAENITNFFQGFLSDKQEVNPYFHNWNVVVQTYCDGGLFSGKRKEALEINGRKLYFRGRPILKAMVESLKRRNLESANDIILSGTSAGGLAVLLQGDYLKHRLPRTATVRGLVDAGFFLDSPSEDGSNVVENQFKGLFDIHQPKLRMKCENGKDNSTKYQCLFPQQTILHTKLPVYFVNALYDHWQLSELQRLHCVYNNDNCIPEQRDRILNFRNVMYDHLLDALGHMKNAGLYADSCIGHGQVIVDYTWTRIRVNNQTINDAFHDWFNDRSGEKRHINTDCRYPCNGSCPRAMVRSCIKNFKGASNKYRTKRSAELC